MGEQILQKYIFPKNRDIIFESCDFHLSEEDSEEKDVYSSSIPTTLKELSVSKKDPHLVLFYFNREEDILEDWEKLGTELPDNNIKLDNSLDDKNKELPKIQFRCVNLDYEKKIYHTFKNITISNPYHWAKYFSDKKRYFILFYLNTLPIEFFNDIISENKIMEKYYKDGKDNYYGKFLSLTSLEGRKYLEDQKEKKFKAFDSLKLKGRYFQALQDDKPFTGVIKGKYYRVIETEAGEFKLFEL